MRRVTWPLLVLTVLPAEAATAPRGAPRKGKVVRVERLRAKAAQRPRLCQVRYDGGATCFGSAVAPGEEGVVFDDTGVRGRMELEQVTPTLDACGNPQAWEVTGRVTAGDPSQLAAGGVMLVGWRAGDRARLATQPVDLAGVARPNEGVWNGFDADGDGDAELAVTSFTCDASGQTSPNGTVFCMAYYDLSTGAPKELRVDVVSNCY